MDFIQINNDDSKGKAKIAPDFLIGRSEDLMVRGRAFYAIWDEQKSLWSTDEYDVQRLVDEALSSYVAEKGLTDPSVSYMRSFKSQSWNQFRKFVSQISDNAHPLDEKLTFADTPVKKKDYASRRLSYNLTPGDIAAWDELLEKLYAPEERAKIEWAIGSVVSGDSKEIQKFLVFYGSAGTGKSTIMNIVQKLFDGYTTSFEAKALGAGTNAFATAPFARNPLVAIQHDGDLSKIADNTLLNAIISHEPIEFNEKFKPAHTSKSKAMLLMGTNQPVKISDAKSGIIRRLIDVHPTGDKFEPGKYHALMSQINFELGAIADHCLKVYRSMGKNYYNSYRPLEMMYQTDIFFNFVEANYDIFKAQDGCSLRQAYSLYKEFCSDTGIDARQTLPQYKVREELRNYFADFSDRTVVDGVSHRSYYSGFTAAPFKAPVDAKATAFSLVMDEVTSLFDLEYAESAAQPAKDDGTPQKRWAEVKTTLAEVDTSRLHYVLLEENHIVIDFDLRGDDGEKSLERNLAAASEWPPTYAELSKSGQGVHLHYLYDGDTDTLASSYDDGIEVKVFRGNSSLRRRLHRCNNVPVATISSGLPIKEKKVLAATTIESERGLRNLILRNLRKEIHPGTKPSMDFIKKILDDAYDSGMQYDVTDMQNKIIAFANNSRNNPLVCLKMAMGLRYKSSESVAEVVQSGPDDRLVFFDCEVYPNLFVICWKFQGSPEVTRMINPTPQEVEGLFQFKLIGFNNRRYDNHIMYARSMGYDNERLYQLSQKIVSNVTTALFGEAYNLSYTDIYDFSSIKMGLKKFQIALKIPHKEMNLPWDQDVRDEDLERVVEYCVNDVRSAEAVFESRKGDFTARQILAELSGLTPNDTTHKHTAKIIFGDAKNPQREFIYTDLSVDFPGYVFDKGVSTYRGEIVGEGGYVHAEPGMYQDVALLDVASMHPTSLIQLNAFGEFTPRFAELVEARLAIKTRDVDRASHLLGGRLAKYLGAPESNKALSDALKIAINIVYGLTSASFDNPFRDIRNKDNIVAKRGALFMIDLKHHIQNLGFAVVHIKTDSVKIPGATSDIISEVQKFGEKYGYKFEYDPEVDQYDSFCLVNDAVFIAKQQECITPRWKAVGSQFQHPYVYKTLFERDDMIEFDDLCETKQVAKGAIYLAKSETDEIADMRFVGKTGRFVPVRDGLEGSILYRVMDGRKYIVTGTKGYRWVEADTALKMLANGEGVVDMGYFDRLADEARITIDAFGNFEEFVHG